MVLHPIKDTFVFRTSKQKPLYSRSIPPSAEKDYRAPAQYRVNGVVRKIDSWYKAFNINKNDKLYIKPESRVKL
ncbi:M13-type metalloendopeptidase [Chryseobacterium indologenes]|uniref:M13-type metalloendopeptidase n=1 Tax=Chryseobacterium indologenes TaxID=253 RepID=UPI0010244FB2|nr:Peptidase family M13 [Chryseobacterium indologenes]